MKLEHKIVPLDGARSERPVRVIVAGTKPYHLVIAEALAGSELTLLDHVETGEALLDRLKREDFDCIIADQMVGDESSLQLHATLELRMPATPAMIMVTSESSDKTILRAFRKGVSDFVATDHDFARELLQAVRRAVERSRKDQILLDEIAHLSKLASYDRLTGVPNRNFLDDRLKGMIAGAQRHSGRFSVFLIDINNFRAINDIYGHAVADRALKAFAKRLMQTARSSDTFGRYGGDEFIYLIDRDVSHENAEAACRRITAALSFSIELETVTLSMSPSIGVAVFPYDGRTIEALLNSASQAMQVARANGGGYHLAQPPTETEAVVITVTTEAAAAPAHNGGHASGTGGREQNRRGEHRDRVFRRGRIVLGDGFSTIDCVIRDISPHGARITVENQVTIPRLISFAVLDIGQTFPAMRRWQRGTSIGIEFATEAVEAAKQKEAAA